MIVTMLSLKVRLERVLVLHHTHIHTQTQLTTITPLHVLRVKYR